MIEPEINGKILLLHKRIYRSRKTNKGISCPSTVKYLNNFAEYFSI